MLFSTQVIVTKELDGKSHKWLKALSGNLKKDDICELLNDMAQMTGKADNGVGNDEIEAKIMKSYGIDVEEVGKYIQD